MVGGERTLALIAVDLRLARATCSDAVSIMPPSPLVTTFVG